MQRQTSIVVLSVVFLSVLAGCTGGSQSATIRGKAELDVGEAGFPSAGSGTGVGRGEERLATLSVNRYEPIMHVTVSPDMRSAAYVGVTEADRPLHFRVVLDGVRSDPYVVNESNPLVFIQKPYELQFNEAGTVFAYTGHRNGTEFIVRNGRVISDRFQDLGSPHIAGEDVLYVEKPAPTGVTATVYRNNEKLGSKDVASALVTHPDGQYAYWRSSRGEPETVSVVLNGSVTARYEGKEIALRRFSPDGVFSYLVLDQPRTDTATLVVGGETLSINMTGVITGVGVGPRRQAAYAVNPGPFAEQKVVRNGETVYRSPYSISRVTYGATGETVLFQEEAARNDQLVTVRKGTVEKHGWYNQTGTAAVFRNHLAFEATKNGETILYVDGAEVSVNGSEIYRMTFADDGKSLVYTVRRDNEIWREEKRLSDIL